MTGIANEGNVTMRRSKKPEQLMKRIIKMGSNKNDLVLDSFAGSGTTGAVAHKLGRKWILIEIGDHAEILCKKRLSDVVNGVDTTGISKQTEFSGGGGFAFCELGEPLIVADEEFDIKRINPKYNNGDLIKAVCKEEGFGLYRPKGTLHGRKGNVFIHVSEFFINQDYLDHLTSEVSSDQRLVIYCYSYSSKLNILKNIEIKRMPNDLKNVRVL